MTNPLRVAVFEPFPHLQLRVEAMVVEAGHEVVHSDEDVALVCLDAPNPAWRDARPEPGQRPTVASAIRASALENVPHALTTLTRPFDTVALADALSRAAQALAEPGELAEGDVSGLGDASAAATVRSESDSHATVPVRPMERDAAYADALVAAATEIANSMHVLALTEDRDARVDAILTILGAHLKGRKRG